MDTFTAALMIASVVWVIRKLDAYLRDAKNRLPYPPGPTPKPLIGNMLDFPTVNIPQAYAEWSRRYNSPIVHAEALGTHVLIINSFEVAEELLEHPERGKIYSDRPYVPIFSLMKWDYNLAMIPYGDWWRRHRRVCQQNFNAHAVRSYNAIQTKKMRQFLQGLLETPRDFDSHNKMFSVGLTVAMMYGYDLKSIEDSLVTIADDAILLGTRLMAPGGSLINLIPALQHFPSWFPGTSSLKTIARVREMTEEVMRIPIDFIMKSFQEGTVTSSLVADFYEKKFTVGASAEEEQVVNNVALTVYGAASDTTISATGSFFYTMATHPEVQKKAQAEIDLVTGSKRLPTHEDRMAMPYVEAIYREVMRYNPPVPLCVPRSCSEDGTYNGYLIPKGATILTNIWAMTHNEEVYPDPFAFKPERFLDDNGKLNNDDRVLAYGFGRRVCVGRHVADATMWLIIASILACFDITKAKDENGNVIEVDGTYDHSGLISQKEKFECDFRVRSAAMRNLIVETI